MGPGRRAAIAVCAILAPLAWVCARLLPPVPGALACGLLVVAAAFLVARFADARLSAHALAVRRWAAGDDDARPPHGDELGAALSGLREGVDAAVGAWSRDEEQLSAVLTQMAEGVVAVDGTGKVLLVNPALSRLLGVDAERAKGRPYLESVRHHGLVDLLAAILGGGPSQTRELRLFTPDELVFEAHAVPLFEHGRAAGAVVVLHDITRLRRLEQMRRDFVANVGHELRTPLASIKGYAETLREGAMDDRENRDGFVRTIEEQADRLSKLVDDLLDLSAIESGHRAPRLAPLNLEPLASDCSRQLQPAATQRGVEIAVSVPESLPRASADRDQVRQILLNLLDNAVKYSERGGKIEVGARSGEEGIVVWVRDQGVGIPEADLPRVFERFYRVDKARAREAGGTGLGLAIVKHLVEAHGGRVWVESRQPGGSTFSFTLRAA
jgi:two-component system phosphate regulon sensor histidine kinase PhoR